MTDFISREALENWVREEVASLDSKEDREFVIQRWRKEIPAADVAPVVHGRWIKKEFLRCSECDMPTMYPWPYCQKCGAKMDGGIQDATADRRGHGTVPHHS